MKIYVTQMNRWGDETEHSYVIYTGFNKTKAISEGKEEKTLRGNKYDFKILEFEEEVPTFFQVKE